MENFERYFSASNAEVSRGSDDQKPFADRQFSYSEAFNVPLAGTDDTDGRMDSREIWKCDSVINESRTLVEHLPTSFWSAVPCNCTFDEKILEILLWKVQIKAKVTESRQNYKGNE